MKKAILGRKVGMTQIFTESGTMIPVTVVEAGPCTVVQKKTVATDGYDAIQVGFGSIREKLLNKPQKGQYLKAGVGFKRYLREFKMTDVASYEPGQIITADVFAQGDKVDIKGVSRGKGTMGPIARWGLHRGPMSHGSGYHRGHGSMSANSSPSRVFKGKKLAGRVGNEKVTIQNLEVVRVDAEQNLLLVKGSVPGNRGSLLFIRDSIKA